MILCLGAHPDDVELGLGATLNQLTAYVYACSPCRKSNTRNLAQEMNQSLAEYEAELIWELAAFPVRDFPEHRQDILETFITLRKQLHPQIVFTHTTHDKHQDHRIVTEEAQRAFPDATIFGYYLPWNTRHLHYDYLHPVSMADLDTKQRALKHYQSQDKWYFDWDWQRAQATFLGGLIQQPYADGFEIIQLRAPSVNFVLQGEG